MQEKYPRQFLNSPTPVCPPTPEKAESTGLLVSRDLIFTTKVRGTASELGYPMMVAQTQSQALSMIESFRPRVVLVDLTAGGMAAPSALMAYQKRAGTDVWFVGFGPHVEVDVLAAATGAGCHLVMPRSKFAAELPELMRRCFSQPPAQTS
jgi:hypothetical protein